MKARIRPLAVTQQQFSVGQNVEVSVDFQYTSEEAGTVYLYAAPYNYNLTGTGKLRGNSCTAYSPVSLVVTQTSTDKTATVEFPLTPASDGGISDGTYGLAVWLQNVILDQDPWNPKPGTLMALITDDNLLTVSGNANYSSSSSVTGLLTSLLPMVMLLLMVGMIAPMMQGTGDTLSGGF